MLTNKKLGLNSEVSKAYKLCDFKPSYGILFEELLSEFDFWAYSDIDLILGNLPAFGLYNSLGENDIVSLYNGFASGPFCIIRNTKDVNKLFMQVSSYKQILEAPEYIGFDEHIVKDSNLQFSFRKVLYFLEFLLDYLFSKKLFQKTKSQFKFEFQWFLKRKTITEPVDFTEAVLKYTDKGEIRSQFRKHIFNDTDYSRSKITNWEIEYKNGRLFDNLGNDIPIFHFMESKKNQELFSVDERQSIIESFKISVNGIREV